MIFARETGIAIKQAPKHRALLIYEGLETPPGILDEPWSRLRISAKLGGGRAKRYWSRYWPLVTGFVLIEAKERGGRPNPLASVLIDADDDHEAIYGNALLLGYDPTAKDVCSIPDETIISATEAFFELAVDLERTSD